MWRVFKNRCIWMNMYNVHAYMNITTWSIVRWLSTRSGLFLPRAKSERHSLHACQCIAWICRQIFRLDVTVISYEIQHLVWGWPTTLRVKEKENEKGNVFVLLLQTKHTTDKQNEGKRKNKLYLVLSKCWSHPRIVVVKQRTNCQHLSKLLPTDPN